MKQSIINERSDSRGFRKILKSILSSTTEDHIEGCRRMIDNYLKVYGEGYNIGMRDRCNTLRGYLRLRLKSIRGDD